MLRTPTRTPVLRSDSSYKENQGEGVHTSTWVERVHTRRSATSLKRASRRTHQPLTPLRAVNLSTRWPGTPGSVQDESVSTVAFTPFHDQTVAHLTPVRNSRAVAVDKVLLAQLDKQSYSKELMGQISDLEKQVLEMCTELTHATPMVTTAQGSPGVDTGDASTIDPTITIAEFDLSSSTSSTSSSSSEDSYSSTEESKLHYIMDQTLDSTLVEQSRASTEVALEEERSKNLALRSELMSLQRQLSRERAEADESKESYTSTITSLHREMSDLKAQLDRLNDDKVRVETRHDHLVIQNRALRGEVQTTADKLEQSTHDCNTLMKERDHLQETITSLEAKCTDIAATVHTLEQKNHEYATRVTELESARDSVAVVIDAECQTDEPEHDDIVTSANKSRGAGVRPESPNHHNVRDRIAKRFRTMLCPKYYEMRLVERLISKYRTTNTDTGPFIGCILIRCIWSFEGDQSLIEESLLQSVSASVQQLGQSSLPRSDAIFWLSNLSMLEHFLRAHSNAEVGPSINIVQNVIRKLFFLAYSDVSNELSPDIATAFSHTISVDSPQPRKTGGLWSYLNPEPATLADVLSTLTKCADLFRSHSVAPVYFDAFFREVFRWMFGFLFNTLIQGAAPLEWDLAVRLRHHVASLQRWAERVNLGHLVPESKNYRVLDQMCTLLLCNKQGRELHTTFDIGAQTEDTPDLSPAQRHYIARARYKDKDLPHIKDVVLELHQLSYLPSIRTPCCEDYDLVFAKTVVPDHVAALVPFVTPERAQRDRDPGLQIDKVASTK